jgi:hypothetical protein
MASEAGERANVADDHPEVVERAGRLMQKVRTPSEAFPMQALDELEGP